MKTRMLEVGKSSVCGEPLAQTNLFFVRANGFSPHLLLFLNAFNPRAEFP